MKKKDVFLFEELTESEREQKKTSEDYTKLRLGKLVKCPACKNHALLRKKIQRTSKRTGNKNIISPDLILKDLSCFHCGLNLTDYDQLKLEFTDEERSLKKYIIYDDCPDDCPPYYGGPDDCPDDCPPYYGGPDDCPDDCY